MYTLFFCIFQLYIYKFSQDTLTDFSHYKLKDIIFPFSKYGGDVLLGFPQLTAEEWPEKHGFAITQQYQFLPPEWKSCQLHNQNGLCFLILLEVF